MRRGRGNKRYWNQPDDMKHPHGLRGREIGHYYRDLGRKRSREFTIKFSIPNSVERRMKDLLQDITKTKEGELFKMHFTKTFSKNTVFDKTNELRFVVKDVQSQPNDLPEFISLKSKEGGADCHYVDKVKIDYGPKEVLSVAPFTGNISTSSVPDVVEIKEKTEHKMESEFVFVQPKVIDNKVTGKSNTSTVLDAVKIKEEFCEDNGKGTSEASTSPIKKVKAEHKIESEFVFVHPKVIDNKVTGKPNTSTVLNFVKVKEEICEDNEKVTSEASTSSIKEEKSDNKVTGKSNTSTVLDVVKIKEEFCEDNEIGTREASTSPIKKVKAEHKIESEYVFVQPKVIDNKMTDKPNNSTVLDFVKVKEEICKDKEKVTSEASTSSTPDFIKVKQEIMKDYVDSNTESLRVNNFKFTYEDIITGSFEEKLNDCILYRKPHKPNNDSLNEAYFCEHEEMLKRPQYQQMLSFRKKLPTYKKTAQLLEVIKNNQVVVISGETGCGKSTQVPQIILDDAMMRRQGAATKIVVTQPRRIAASSLAERVAKERGEALGHSVGYAVRLEKVLCRPECSIIFYTTGVLLAELETNQGLMNISHIILDEVHERDVNVDFTMCMLRMILEKRKDLKVILMSATLDADRLSGYFGGCPLMHIEGLAYAVKDIYLEDFIDVINYRLEPIDFGKPKSYKNRQNSARDFEQDIKYKAEVGPWLETIKHKLTPDGFKTLLDARIEILDIDLLVCLLAHISRGDPGAILVFLPGISDITKCMTVMDRHNQFPKHRFEVWPLHSRLPSLEQHRIFERPPRGVRKIILATNIAETSITIDDIVYVIDCARIKIKGLNVEEHVSTLKVEWISKANLMQRRGRAGRCQEGICYHLLTSFRAEKLLERPLPELQRSDLLEPVLTIKKLRLGKAAYALPKVLDPPAMSTIEWAVKHLRQCGALSADEVLTPLGWHLARLPAHPAAGKLLLLGSLFGCLDRAASIAAIWGFKEPFQLVIGKETEIDEVKRSFALGEPSDHVAMSEAMLRWEMAGHNRRNYAYKNFLSHNTLELLSDMKNQFGDNLRQMGFLPSGNVKSKWENRNGENLSLFKAIIAASLYPNMATVRWINLKSFKRCARIVVRCPEGKVQVHPSSIMGIKNDPRTLRRPLCQNPGANWCAYWIKQKSKYVYLLDVTLVYTLPLLFFGEMDISEVENAPEECYISISSFKVKCPKDTARLLFELRSMLDRVLANKVAASQHSDKNNEFEQGVLDAVIEMITTEDEGTEYNYEGGDSDTSDN